jgi:hypothetical protein
MGSSFGGSSSTFCFGSNFPDMLRVASDQSILRMFLFEMGEHCRRSGAQGRGVKSGKWRLGIDRAYFPHLRATTGRSCLRINEKELVELLLNHLVCTPLGTQNIILYCSARDVSAVWSYDLEKLCDLDSARSDL